MSEEFRLTTTSRNCVLKWSRAGRDAGTKSGGLGPRLFEDFLPHGAKYVTALSFPFWAAQHASYSILQLLVVVRWTSCRFSWGRLATRFVRLNDFRFAFFVELLDPALAAHICIPCPQFYLTYSKLA